MSSAQCWERVGIVKQMALETKKIRRDPDKYMAALRDWVANGESSRYALSSDEVLKRSEMRTSEAALGAAHFELGQYFQRKGRTDKATSHFRQSHRLQPDNWTYRRQAWGLVNPLQGPTDQYDSDWLSDVRKIGAENYYPLPDLD